MTQQALPLDIPFDERDYHAHDNWSTVLCRRCGKVLWHPIHGLPPIPRMPGTEEER